MKIYGLCLSNNPDSINKKFLQTIIDKIDGEMIDFAETDFPLFKVGDAEPAQLQTLCDKLQGADGIIIASPEYNGTISPFGKNVLDWISIKGFFDGAIKKTALSGKPTMVCGVAPGPLGGIRAVPDVSKIAIELGCVIHKTFATTGGFNGDAYDYSKAFTTVQNFKDAIKK